MLTDGRIQLSLTIVATESDFLNYKRTRSRLWSSNSVASRITVNFDIIYEIIYFDIQRARETFHD